MRAWIRTPIVFQKSFPRGTLTKCALRHATTCTSTGQAQPPHKAVLVRQLLSHLPDSTHKVIDCTLGAGGHATEILRQHRIDTYIGIDKDPMALQYASDTLPTPPVQVVRGDFRDLSNLVDDDFRADAVIMDVGVSSMQLDDATRGFSFTRDGPLDMRMTSCGCTAADLINSLEEEDLARIIYEYGEERAARRIARAVVEERSKRQFGSTGELAELIVRVKGWRRKGVHPATQTFQALRIAVNGELEALEAGIRAGVEKLRVGGRIGVISFHSLEDRIVKRLFRELTEVKGGVKVVTRKPVVSDEEEVRENVRCRSAKLRLAERVAADVVGKVEKVNKYRM